MNFEELIEDGIYNCPLALLSIKDRKMIDKINNYLPYSIGIEIECMKSSNFNLVRFQDIPDIMCIDIDNSEQRFRIPNGLAGLICLYNICDELKINSELNPDSGHHYHVDMTNTYSLLNEEFVRNNKKWILDELDTWNYKGTYNRREITFDAYHNWVRFQNEFKTAEFRIGNMTFDYSTIVRRLIHACTIIQRLNKQLIDIEKISYNNPNFEQLKNRIKTFKYHNKLEYLTNELKAITKDDISISNEQIKSVIQKRVIKLDQND